MILTALLSLAIVTPSPRHPERAAKTPEAVARVARVYAAIDAATDDPEMRIELVNVCARESWCGAFSEVGIHELQERPPWVRKVGARWHGVAVKRGWLDPETCEAHVLGDPARWYNVGYWSLQPGRHLRYLDGCQGPLTMAEPEPAAVAYVANAARLCAERKLCTCEERTPAYVGLGLFAGRSPWSRAKTVARQCGPRPWREYAKAAMLTLPHYLGKYARIVLTYARVACTVFEQ